jgi:hypothetical protein
MVNKTHYTLSSSANKIIPIHHIQEAIRIQENVSRYEVGTAAKTSKLIKYNAIWIENPAAYCLHH